MADEYRDLLETETILPGDEVYDIRVDVTGAYLSGVWTASHPYAFRTPRECRARFRRSIASKPQRSLYDAMQAIRDAGGSEWDRIPDPEAYLRGDDDDEAATNAIRRAYIHRHPSPDKDVPPSMWYSIICADGVWRHAATWEDAVAVFDASVQRECERKWVKA